MATATYVNENQFTVAGNVLANVRIGSRLRLDQGTDGVFYDDVAVAIYDSGVTRITTFKGLLTSNLESVLAGPTFVDDVAHESNISQHTHDSEWQGGFQYYSLLNTLQIVTNLLVLTELSTATSNFLFGVNAAGDSVEAKALEGTENQIVVTNEEGLITLATPQDIAPESSPTFAGLTLTNHTGLLIAAAGILGSTIPSAGNQIYRSNSGNTAMEWAKLSILNCDDVVLSNPQEGQALIYSSGKWRNGTVSSGSSGVSVGTVLALIQAFAPESEGSGGVAASHASTHIDGGDDPIDSDKLEISFVPTFSTPALVTDIADQTDQLAAHLQGIDTAIGALQIPTKENYCPDPFLVSASDDTVMLTGSDDFFAFGYRAFRKYEREHVYHFVNNGGGPLSACVRGGKLDASWYAIFANDSYYGYVALPFIRIKAVTWSSPNTKLEFAVHDDHTTAENGFITANDQFNDYRVIPLTSALVYSPSQVNVAEYGAAYSIVDTVNTTGDYILVGSNLSGTLYAGDWAMLVPPSDNDAHDNACCYLGCVRVSGSGILAVNRLFNTWDYYFTAAASVDGNKSASAGNTFIGSVIPPIAKMLEMDVSASSSGGVNAIGIDLYRGLDGTTPLKSRKISTGTSDIKALIDGFKWKNSGSTYIRNRFYQDSSGATNGSFLFTGFSE